jgi:hypothetical protein
MSNRPLDRDSLYGNFGAPMEEMIQDLKDIKNNGNSIDAQARSDVNGLKTQVAERAKEVTPLLFGAKGDGIADDRQALTDTFNYAMTNGYTVNLLDTKTYLVKSVPWTTLSGSSYIFDITSKISIQGKSTVKLGFTGDYDAVFRLRTGASSSTFKEFTLDENTTNNPTIDNTSPVVANGQRRIAFYGWNATPMEDVIFERLTIKNCIGMWQIHLRANNCRVDNVTVDYEKNNNGVIPAYDRTCVYMAGANWVLRDSRFLGSDKARTCIELHGKNIMVDNNYVNDFSSMLYVVNDNESGATNLENAHVINNKFKCRRGIQFWFSVNNCNFDNVNLMNNTLEVTGDTPVIEMQEYPGENVVVKNLRIEGNTLIGNSKTSPFLKFLSSSGTSVPTPYVCNNLSIQNNIMTGTCERAIYFGVQPAKRAIYKKIRVANNVFNINELNNMLLYIVDVPYAFESVDVTRNVFNVASIGTGITKVQVFSGAMGGRATNFGQFSLRDNTYNIPNALSVLYANNEGSYFLVTKELLDRNLMTDYTGLSVYQGELRDNYDQLIRYNAGTVTRRIFYASTMPTSGSYTKGDYIFNTATSVLGSTGSKYLVKGWVRVTTGSGHVIGTDWLEDRVLTGS